jgi:phosphomevalonate kinase
MTLTTTTVSCPGKVLLTGGYLVLFDYPGLVLSLSSRFYCQVQDSTLIQITSPQFSDPVYNYPFDNIYVQTTVEMCLVFINHFKHSIPGFTLTLAADNDFYSQRSDMRQRGLSLCTKDLASLPKFNSLHCSISEVHKTGLGSSAAMISSIVGALLLHFDICSLDAQGKKWIHNLSQFCHCLAQGKIGSGFDVSSAIYGSHRYKRFSKQILEPFLEKATKRQLCSRELAAFITETEWNNEILDFSLPPQIEILMGDVDSGSNTPKLVSKVLAFCARDETLCNFYFIPDHGSFSFIQEA